MKKQSHSTEKITRHTQKEARKLKDLTDYEKLDAISDSDIDYSDILETNETVWAKAQVNDPGIKKAISLRVDSDVLDWFKHQDGRYQRLMNLVLRQYMKSH